MNLIDTNIIIYSAQKEFTFLRPLVFAPDSHASVISMVEAVGFHKISAAEKEYFENAFDSLQLIKIDEAVLAKTIEIRQERKMDMGDAFIAATALLYGLELVTRNTKDFKNIPGLTIVDPFDKSI